MTSPDTPSAAPPSRPVVGMLALAALLGGLVVAWVYQRARAEALDGALVMGQQRLGLYASTIRAALDRFSYLPATIALDREVIEVLEGEPDRADALSAKLETINAGARSASLYVMDRKGVTVSASNWRTPLSYVGNDYSFRPYFTQVMSAGAGHFFGIGVTTKLPGYFLASGVRGRAGDIIGAVVVKIDLETLEEDWGRGGDAVMVTDEDGVVILTSRPEWKYAVDGPVTEELRRKLDAIQRYGAVQLRALERRVLLSLGDAARLERNGDARFVAQAQALDEEGWTIHYLADWEAMESNVRSTAALAGLGWIAFILLLLYLRQRRLVLKAKLDARDTLEALVALRTEALSAEIVERQRTEHHLRETQDELIHAGKMAALGQMSAAIAHELNQPLAAIQTFVASSRIFVERGDAATAGTNLSMIDDLCRRMAEIIRHLRVFARKSPVTPQVTDPAASVSRAVALLAVRLRQAEIDLVWNPPEGLMVSGDPGRLDQVFVNLLANAIDAVADAPARRIVIDAVRVGGEVAVSVADSGPGLPSDVADRVFEPFFTTKEVGEGLGLGLSLSYGIIRDMGGSIRADNRAGGGAVFVITLPNVSVST
ncbi:sensor histidine kinase, transcriptional regulator of C4-dicarboxylate transport [Magnetospirillum sp. XM-1]|uniref:sensor histidine kinase n=1 Tax=Magnetospirillum sp. XM-1 TaxID=1663591 RepID=UPI00073DE3B8|nr:ATP-binding protein [Magnetospirillum sp. XM-1]CUW40969.1 sensor histidine kinase, transcriptional regulator of C4-dicarboxylate transport [Magnetospirillum sp. XM-1]